MQHFLFPETSNT